MDATPFGSSGNCKHLPALPPLPQTVAEDAQFHEGTTGVRFGDPLAASLSLIVVAALWKLLNVGIDTLRRMSEDATVQRRIQLIRELQEMGYQRQAPFIVDRLLKDMRERPEDDPVLKKLTDMYPAPSQSAI